MRLENENMPVPEALYGDYPILNKDWSGLFAHRKTRWLQRERLKIATRVANLIIKDGDFDLMNSAMNFALREGLDKAEIAQCVLMYYCGKLNWLDKELLRRTAII